jgi:hypothetical protein
MVAGGRIRTYDSGAVSASGLVPTASVGHETGHKCGGAEESPLARTRRSTP